MAGINSLLTHPKILSSLMTLGVPFATGGSALLGQSPNLSTREMDEELERQIMSDIRRKGTYNSGIGYKDLGWDTMYTKSGEHIDPSGGGFFGGNSNGLFSPQTAIGMSGGKMDWAVDPATGKVQWKGGDYDFGTKGSEYVDSLGVGWNPNIQLDPALIQKEINAFSPQERYRQGQIEIQKPKEVYPNTEEHFKQKFQEDKIPFKVVREPWNKPTQTATPQQIQQATMMDNQLQHQTTQGGLGPNGGRAQAAPKVTAPVLPAPVSSTPVRSVSPGGGNSRRTYSKPAATAPSVSRPRARATRGRSAPIVRQSRNGPPQNRFR